MRSPALALLIGLLQTSSQATGAGQTPAAQTPMFKAGVDLVMVSVVVQTKNGQPVTDLTRDDFLLMDNGQAKTIQDFRKEPSPVYVALLFDISGSMDVASKMDDGKRAARQVMSWLEPDRDHAALFGFGADLTAIVPFSAPLPELDHALESLHPFGATSLYDAIASTGKRVASEGGPRRAIVAITDGADTSSRLLPADVANLASEIDVPVYIVAVVLPIDREGSSKGAVDEGADKILAGPLGSLARATGGQLFAVSTPAHASMAAKQIITDLRTQYVLSFEPATSAKGFRPLQVLTRKRDLIVRARSGYQGGSADRHH